MRTSYKYFVCEISISEITGKSNLFFEETEENWIEKWEMRIGICKNRI